MSFNRWLVKQTVVRITEYYSAMKRNKGLMYTTAWMNFQRTMLGKRIQPQKVMKCMIPFLKWLNLKNGEQISVCQVLEIGGGGEGRCGYKRTRERILYWQNFSGSWLWWWTCKSTRVIKLHGMKYTSPHKHIHQLMQVKLGKPEITSADHISANILVVILYYNFVKCYH